MTEPLPIYGLNEIVKQCHSFNELVLFFYFFLDPGIEYVIEPPRSPEILIPQSIIPQELDKQDYILVGSKCFCIKNLKQTLLSP